MGGSGQIVFSLSREEDNLPGPVRLPPADLQKQPNLPSQMSSGAPAAVRKVGIFRLHGRAETGDEDWQEPEM